MNKNNKPDWEDAWDKTFNWMVDSDSLVQIDREPIKAFVRERIALAEERGRTASIEEVKEDFAKRIDAALEARKPGV